VNLTAEKSRMRELWEKAAPAFAGADVPWVDRLRNEGMERFDALGFPTRENEEWRFTSVDPIAQAPLRLAQGNEGTLPSKPGLADLPDRLVFVNGFLPHGLSTPMPAGIAAGSLLGFLKSDPKRVQPWLGRLAGAKDGAFTALNSALFTDGAVVILPKGTALARPLHLLFVNSYESGKAPAAAHQRVLIVAERGARATIVVEHAGFGGPYLSSTVAEVYLDDEAKLAITRVQRESEAAWSFGALKARLGRAANLSLRTSALGAAIARDEIEATLEGEGAECRLSGLYLADGQRHTDHWTRIVHAAPHGTSDALYKGVLDGKARAVFNGTIEVAPGASRTDGKIYNKNLLLSEDGLVNTKPEFKIFNNDVQCKHGATIGQLSADALFYLRSRGIGAAEAKSLLVYAFASETIAGEAIEPLREALADSVRGWLEGGAR